MGQPIHVHVFPTSSAMNTLTYMDIQYTNATLQVLDNQAR